MNPRPKRWQRVPLLHSIVFQRLFLVKWAKLQSNCDCSATRFYAVELKLMNNLTRNIVLSPEEETSIILDGNFDQNTYSKNLKLSLSQALAMRY